MRHRAGEHVDAVVGMRERSEMAVVARDRFELRLGVELAQLVIGIADERTVDARNVLGIEHVLNRHRTFAPPKRPLSHLGRGDVSVKVDDHWLFRLPVDLVTPQRGRVNA
jgi:hypothetical protein